MAVDTAAFILFPPKIYDAGNIALTFYFYNSNFVHLFYFTTNLLAFECIFLQISVIFLQ